MRKILPIACKLQGDMIAVAFYGLKEVLPAITNYTNVKTKNNDIILGKWQAKK
tara:strand:- start:231 stop:389 length:159 start_codon:yes stop_codon:yes gene_type:complete